MESSNDKNACARCGWPELRERPVNFPGGLRIVFSIMGGASSSHMMGQQLMGAGVRSGSVSEDDGPYTLGDKEEATMNAAVTGAEAAAAKGRMLSNGPEIPRGEYGDPDQSSHVDGNAHASAPAHAPAGKRSLVEEDETGGENLHRRRKVVGLSALERDSDMVVSNLSAGPFVDQGSPRESESARPPPSESGSSVSPPGSGSSGGTASTSGLSSMDGRGTPPGAAMSLLPKRRAEGLQPTVTIGRWTLCYGCHTYFDGGLCGMQSQNLCAIMCRCLL